MNFLTEKFTNKLGFYRCMKRYGYSRQKKRSDVYWPNLVWLKVGYRPSTTSLGDKKDLLANKTKTPTGVANTHYSLQVCLKPGAHTSSLVFCLFFFYIPHPYCLHHQEGSLPLMEKRTPSQFRLACTLLSYS